MADQDKAIEWATDECEADIVSMSFGFEAENDAGGYDPIRRAIHDSMKNHDRTLYFAAAGNEGANIGRVMFPARHELVIPVYGTDAKGAFLNSLNPIGRLDYSAMFGTLAQDIPCAGLSSEGEVRVTGTSFATAIAAGLAGMLLEYTRVIESRQRAQGGLEVPWSSRLSARRGMIALFSNIAEQSPDRRYYLHPTHFFQRSEDVKMACIVKAYDESR